MSDVDSRQRMDVDIVCVGLGPATGGFLTTLSQHLTNEDGTPKLESKVMPGMPLQVICYERADDIGFGVSGVVSKARAIKQSLPDFKPSDIPLAASVKKEKLLYLLDPIGVSGRSFTFKIVDKIIKFFKWIPFYKDFSFDFPFIPPFMNKHGGFVFSIGQLNAWVGSQIMGSGLIQLWPGTPVEEPIIKENKVLGVRLVDQGTDKHGKPEASFMPGMDIHSKLVVVGDGPVGSIGQILDERFGLPANGERKDWAVGSKMLVELKDHSKLEPGTVIHTIGYPEPEIFGFLYVLPGGLVSIGIFIPSWFDSPIKTSYRYLQHWMKHPKIWKYLEGGTLKSWGAKSLQESGKRGEPFLVGDGFARIGEGSGSTNLLSNSGVDEAWMTGVLLAEAVVELAKENKSFTKENLDRTYVQRRKNSWLEKEARIAKKSRDGFQKGVVLGIIGAAITWLTRGRISIPSQPKATYERIHGLEKFFKGKLSSDEIKRIRDEAYSKNLGFHDGAMDYMGWPKIEYDGKLLISHQDVLFKGGKVQAPGGYKDHVTFRDPKLCETCDNKVCIEICSGQAILPGDRGIPTFDREKCVHCGACLWSCTRSFDSKNDITNISFRAGAGGLHSAEN